MVGFYFKTVYICLLYIHGCVLLQDYDSLFTSTQETIHGKLVDFQNDLVNIQVWPYVHFNNDDEYLLSGVKKS
jgi:hypothetical protein